MKANLQVIELPGPILFGRRRTATITIRRHQHSATVLWDFQITDIEGTCVDVFSKRFRAHRMIEALEAWWTARAALLPKGARFHGGEDRGRVVGLPHALVHLWVALIREYFDLVANDRPPMDAASYLPVRFVEPEDPSNYTGKRLIACPVCRCEHVQLYQGIVILAGKDGYQARSCVRGDVTCLPGECQAGHRFTICFGSHKGLTQLWTERLRNKPSQQPLAPSSNTPVA